jgi:hypothetical protein
MTASAKACAQSNLAGLQFVRTILRLSTDTAVGAMQLARALLRHSSRGVPADPFSRRGHLLAQGFPLVCSIPSLDETLQ